MSFIRRYPAALILTAMALFFNALHYYMEVEVQAQPGSPAYWWTTTSENLQSELWQIVVAAFVFEHWRWARSPEANEDAPNTRWALLVPAVVVVLCLIVTATISTRVAG